MDGAAVPRRCQQRRTGNHVPDATRAAALMPSPRWAQLSIISLLLAGEACTRPKPDPVDTVATSNQVAATTEESPDSVARRVADAISRRDIQALADLVHPQKGVRFSPYPHVDTMADRRITGG